MTAPSPEPPGAGSWVSRFALSPRAAVVLAAVVVALALVVVAIGTLGARSSAGVTVTSGPSAAEARPSPETGHGASPGPASADAPGVGTPTGSASAAAVSVYVLGAVVRAGVVEVPVGTRVDAVLQQAGGATADADLARLNLARPVVDGERLYVPRVGETAVPEALRPDVPGTGGPGAAGSGGGGSSAGGIAGSSGAGGVDPGADVVDLNTADQATLETLPGIGPALAARILAWREEHGGFSSVDDLLEVSGIGDTRLAELRDRVRV